MSVRRLLSLLHGIGYSAVPIDDVQAPSEEPLPLSSKAEVRDFFGGATRVQGGE